MVAGEHDEVEAGVERVMGNVGLERVRRRRREEGRDEVTPRGGKGGGFLSDVCPACRCGSIVRLDVYGDSREGGFGEGRSARACRCRRQVAEALLGVFEVFVIYQRGNWQLYFHLHTTQELVLSLGHPFSLRLIGIIRWYHQGSALLPSTLLTWS